MPDNRALAEQDLISLKRKFRDRDPDNEEYKKLMRLLLEKGYATRVFEEQLNCNDGRIRFVANHGIYHPKKKKFRVVFDCTASYQGVSLNNHGVLTRFREETIGMKADTESMPYHIKVPEEHSDLLRFL